MIMNTDWTLHTLRQKWKWRCHNPVQGSPSVYYGYDSVPNAKEIVSGGIIKCQDLQNLFPNNNENANILYLVSSALPDAYKSMIMAMKKKGVKLVWNQNGVAYKAWYGLGWEKTNEMLAYGLHQADYVVYQSRFCKMAADKFLGQRKGEFTILPNPVDTSFFLPATTKPGGFRVLIAGTHNERYRVSTALKAFAHLLTVKAESNLIVAGPFRWLKDADEAYLDFQQMCRQLNLGKSVEWIGPYSQIDALQIFQSCHVLLHTQYNDACPRLVIEAMSCGLPIVYSSTGGTPELVGDEAGVGVAGELNWEKIQTPSHKVLARGLERICNNYTTYSDNARSRAVDLFDTKSWVSKHELIFNSILS